MNHFNFKPGDRVNYNGENGIVKVCMNGFVYVVFNCGDDWDNYHNYTAAQCSAASLSFGWDQSRTNPAPADKNEQQ